VGKLRGAKSDTGGDGEDQTKTDDLID